MRVLFRESSILVRFFIPFSFALDTMLLPFIRFETQKYIKLRLAAPAAASQSIQPAAMRSSAASLSSLAALR
eukprot:scaffold4322_cov82-Phaeocystis_antarctica.AAC.2